ncbi:MAG: RsmF rRNA methyltransferase first C-terminal domain-containing protein [Clostridiales bacterium]|nr:RsmF rRNA methyltransferase first C-terminal domain-containing protein [Clostridiales bacterium]
MRLPESFKERMKEQLGPEYDPFLASFDEVSPKGIRINTYKAGPDHYNDIVMALEGSIRPVPWTSCGFYSDSESRGTDPYYHAGVYYPQEPSAMLPAEIIAAKPGEFILDMCAAPGGKACRIGEDLMGKGLLVANEINSERSKALNRNIERTGITNCVILNESPDRIADRLPGFFDKILIDAPCSGEGMFRRDPHAIKSWEDYGPESISKIQREILEASDRLLRLGGEIVYSTCTFAEIEDELMIQGFTDDHPGYKIIRHDGIEGITVSESGPAAGSMRIWPHKTFGDGHFCVHLQKDMSGEETGYDRSPRPVRSSLINKSVNTMNTFLKDILKEESYREFEKMCEEQLIMNGSGMYLMPVDIRLFNGLRIVKSGLFAGEIKMTKTERIFNPSNSFPLTLTRDMIREDSFISFGRDDDRLTRYLKGETLIMDEEMSSGLKKKGSVVVAADRYPLGLAKIAGSILKNLYPKAWRLL